MLARLTCFGHSAAQAPVFVQLPKPSSSILATIALARAFASILPCGSRASWLTLAATNSIAEPFLQAAAHAPQPIQLAASIASSAAGLGIGIALASGTPPVLTEMNPPRLAVNHQVFDYRERVAAPRLNGDGIAIVELTHVELAGGDSAVGTVRMTVDVH